jgi:hypothetical protein
MNDTRTEAEEIKANAMKCEHCTGTVLFYWGRFSITRCDWGCGKLQFEWEHRDGVTRTFLMV